MNINYTFRNLESSEGVKKHLEKNLARLEKYCPFEFNAKAIFQVERHNHLADININANGILMRGESICSDLYVSIDTAIDKIEKQLKKHRKKLKSIKNSRGKQSRKITIDVISEKISHEDYQEDDSSKMVVKTKNVQIKPMKMEEAIIQMELLNNDFYVYQDDESHAVNIVYKRQDDNYGLISTETSDG